MISSSLLMTNLGKIGQLSRNDRRLLFLATLLLPIVHLGLILIGYSRLQVIMKKMIAMRFAINSQPNTDKQQRACEIAHIVSIASQHGLYKATCLRRSLLVWWLLQKEGIQSQICFGVRIINNDLKAHAWVELEGNVVNDSASVRDTYQILEDRYPPTQLGL